MDGRASLVLFCRFHGKASTSDLLGHTFLLSRLQCEMYRARRKILYHLVLNDCCLDLAARAIRCVHALLYQIYFWKRIPSSFSRTPSQNRNHLQTQAYSGFSPEENWPLTTELKLGLPLLDESVSQFVYLLLLYHGRVAQGELSGTQMGQNA